MMKLVISIALVLISLSSFSQRNFKYHTGINFGIDLFQANNALSDYQYFKSTYNSGVGLSIGMSNKINYKRLYFRLQGSFSLVIQNHDFVFSNEVDNIIDHSVQHKIPQWILDYSIGRDFQLNDVNELHLEFGFSTIGNFSRGGNNSKFINEGSFSSGYINPKNQNETSDENNNIESIEDYEYTMKYSWPSFFRPFIKCGISLPISKNSVVFGVTAQWNRLDYNNFIILSSNEYNAIAESKSRSNSFGFFLNYQF